MPKTDREQRTKPLILVSGTTGYIGGRLVPRLLKAGYRVRVLVRGDTARLSGRPWVRDVEAVVGDVLKPETLGAVMEGVRIAYYLIHRMRRGGAFHHQDLFAAQNFARAAAQAGVERIIYLGSLGDPDAALSDYLRTRQAIGTSLREAGVPVTEFRAAVIIGSGSLFFEMVRHMTERLPVMICPQWVFVRIQPIDVRDVLRYLEAAAGRPESADKIIEIGGPDVLTYAQMMKRYAAIRGLRRLIIAVPVLTPRLSSYWAHWMTPIPAATARSIIDSVRNEAIVRDCSARELFPAIDPMDYDAAVKRALRVIEEGRVETIWSDSLTSSQPDIPVVYLTQEQGLIIEQRRKVIKSPGSAAFRAYCRLGGTRGWPVNWTWRLRGALDRLVGGVGLRRGRRDPTELRVGDALDFWRVEAVNNDHLVRLRAEMKVPGQAWLQFEAKEYEEDLTELVQTAYFAPRGLLGLLYWYLLYPVHSWIFSRMCDEIGRDAEQLGAAETVISGDGQDTQLVGSGSRVNGPIK